MFILFGSLAVLLIVVVVLIIFLTGGGKGNVSNNVVKQPDIYTPYNNLVSQNTEPSSKTIGKINATELSDGRFLLENKNDGYSISVSPDWIMPEEGEVFRLYYGSVKDINAGAELNNSAVLMVKVLDNNNRYGFSEWFNTLDAFTSEELGLKSNYVATAVNGQSLFKNSRKLDEINDYGKSVPRNDSSLINYLLLNDKKAYWISCSALGGNYKNLIQICEDQVKSFLIE